MGPFGCNRSSRRAVNGRAPAAALPPRLIAVLLPLFFIAARAADVEQPEGATGLRPARPAATATEQMVAAANPLAAQAGLQILREGGSAADAAIATQLVLTLVEPQSSGIGGGAFLLYWDGHRIQAYDGRETAPSAATENQFIGADGRPLRFRDAAASGLSVGVPGLLRMLELVHRQHGRLKWARLFEPAIELAQRGFRVSARLHELLERDALLREDAAARAYFYDPHGHAWPAGTLLKNPALAQTLRALASSGGEALYKGPIAAAVVRAARNGPHHSGRIRETDLASYRALEREPLCTPYRRWNVCGMPPPSAAAISIGQTLGILSHFDLRALGPPSADGQPRLQAVHLVAEAERLAFADREMYLADPDFVRVDTAALLDPAYLAQRSRRIGERSMGTAEAGAVPGAAFAPQPARARHSTSHISIVDRRGDALAMTTSIEDAFGSRIFVRGFLLNNELTDFSFVPRERTPDGREAPVANRVQSGKRPLSSMAPTFVFDRASGHLVALLGSPGGTWIILFVVKTLVGLLDWHMDVEEAISAPNYGSRNGPTELEAGRFSPAFVRELQSRGHDVAQFPMTSGVQAIVAAPGPGAIRWIGGADPRREGVAVGD